MAESSKIIICDQEFDVGRRVITWKDDPTISAYTPHCVKRPDVLPFKPAKGVGLSPMRYRGRRLMGADRSLSRLQQILKQFVVHHDGMGSSRGCFEVLHDERGLSVHFLIDNNGDIYQTLDLVECGFQAAGVNEISIGVELCSRGDKLDLTPTQTELYRQFPREKVTCEINGHQWLSWNYTKEQFDAMVALGRTLARVVPGLSQTYPQGGDGEPVWGTLPDPRVYSGYLGHYHVTNQKWDPGPWDFKRFVQQIRGRTFYPVVPGRDSAEIPEEAGGAEEMAQALYDNNEKEVDGGFFPVGPIGQSRLWHGGLHLKLDRGAPIVAPFSGKVVAARQVKEDEWPKIGSSNFVLLRHEMTVGGAQIKFFTLFFHVEDESGDESKRPVWMQKHWKQLQGGDVQTFEDAVGAGEIVARAGEAGPPGKWSGQIHLEIFSEEEIGEKVDPGFWKTFDGTQNLDKKSGPRFCAIPEIINPIDANKNKFLAGAEISAFYRNNPARVAFHKYATRHPSEWGDNGDYENALNAAPDFGALPRAKKHELYESQIASMLWWGDHIGETGLPDDKIVWTYHPITFIAWISDKLHGPAQTAKAIGSESSWNGKKPPAEIKDDAEDDAGGFVDDEDALFGDAAKALDLEKLSNGFPDEPAAK